MPRESKPKWHKKAKLWYANIGPKDKNGRATEVYAPTDLGPRDEGKAWEWFRAKKSELATADTPVSSDTLTVGALCEDYLAHAEHEAGEGRLSAMHYRSKTHHLGHFAASFGGRAASEVNPQDMKRFVAALQRKDYRPNYVANICASASAAFNWGMDTGLLIVNPIKGFTVPLVPDAPERVANRKEAAVWLKYLWRRTPPRLMSAHFDRMNTLMQRMMIRTGARPGELCCLLWSDIKWDTWVATGGNLGAKATIPPERWKTGKVTGKARTIWITPSIARALRRIQAMPNRHPKYVFVHGRGRGGKGTGEPWSDGSTLSKTICRIRRELIKEQAKIRATIENGDDPTTHQRALIRATILDDGDNRLTNYRWRHTAISSLLMDGVDVPTVASLTGTSPNMIYKVYGHLLDSHLATAAGKMVAMRRGK